MIFALVFLLGKTPRGPILGVTMRTPFSHPQPRGGDFRCGWQHRRRSASSDANYAPLPLQHLRRADTFLPLEMCNFHPAGFPKAVRALAAFHPTLRCTEATPQRGKLLMHATVQHQLAAWGQSLLEVLLQHSCVLPGAFRKLASTSHCKLTPRVPLTSFGHPCLRGAAGFPTSCRSDLPAPSSCILSRCFPHRRSTPWNCAFASTDHHHASQGLDLRHRPLPAEFTTGVLCTLLLLAP